MGHSSKTYPQPGGATVEVGTFNFQGRDFSAFGAVVDVANGRIDGYVLGPFVGVAGEPFQSGCYSLILWGGKMIANLRLTGKWLQYGFGGVKNEIFAWSATIDGHVYSGRNSGPGMLLRMRAGRKI
jgi:hypothetical protein